MKFVRNALRRSAAACALLGLALSASTAAAEPPTAETTISERALARAKSYAKSLFYTYAPKQDPNERAASTVAVAGHLMLEAYLSTQEKSYLEKARIAANSVLAAADMNRDDTFGWGRYWEDEKGSFKGSDRKGGNTTFALECDRARNKAYDDEMFDNARIGHFLLDLHAVTGEERYLTATRRMIDDTWRVGEATPEDGFFYYKTIGACDRGWHVKNVNMLMAVPMALLAKATGEAKYRKRLEAMMRAERFEIRRTVEGEPAPNLGYYAVQTMIEQPTRGTYVKRAQTTDLKAPIGCNLKTGSGESCTAHLGLEARSIDIVLRATGWSDLASVEDIKTIMSGAQARDAEMCAKEKTAIGQPRSATFCVAYYCALRHLDAKYGELCLERTADPKWSSPDIILGMFWGRADRYTDKPVKEKDE